jgi:hypothetical protein
MPTSTILSDNGVTSGTNGLKTAGGDDGSLVLQTTTSGGTATTAMTIDTAQNILISQAARATVVTDNDGSFNMNAASNFKCTPSGTITLTFTNITSGQTGNIILVNGSNYTVAAAATTKVAAGALTTLSATGTYFLSYYTDGTNVFVANTGALS